MRTTTRGAVIAGIGALAIGFGLFVFLSRWRLEAPKIPPPAVSAPVPTPGPAYAPARPKSAQSSLSLVDRILDSMQWGNIAFNAPSSLNLQESTQIQLLLGMEHSIEDLSHMIAAKGEKEGARIRVSNRMEARLSGSGFQITAITPEEQAITSKGLTEWQWEAKPTSPGRQHLHLTLTALLTVDGVSTRRGIRTFDRTIEVEVPWGQRVSGLITENWQWLWAAVLVPVGGWLWRKQRRRAVRKQRTDT